VIISRKLNQPSVFGGYSEHATVCVVSFTRYTSEEAADTEEAGLRPIAPRTMVYREFGIPDEVEHISTELRKVAISTLLMTTSAKIRMAKTPAAGVLEAMALAKMLEVVTHENFGVKIWRRDNGEDSGEQSEQKVREHVDVRMVSWGSIMCYR
jgi:hypothetical protein